MGYDGNAITRNDIKKADYLTALAKATNTKIITTHKPTNVKIPCHPRKYITFS
jgi:hypothetical protein